MKVIQDLSDNYPDDVNHYTKFHEMGDDSEEEVLFVDLGAVSNPFYRHQHRNFKRKVACVWEQPCSWLSGRGDQMSISGDFEDYFNEYYTICPYSAEWLNECFHEREKFKLAIVPYNINDIPQVEYEKEYDVIWWGNLHSIDHIHILEAMRNFKSHFYTVHPAHWTVKMEEQYFHRYTNQIAGISEPRRNMWEVLRKTKIFVMTNVIPLTQKNIKSIKSMPYWQKNKAFSHLEQLRIPQMKTRAVEAAFNKTLSLVKRDPWNVIEYFFEPEVDFLYYDSNEELPGMIKKITENWDDYKHIVDNAYNKAVEHYTSQKLFEIMSAGK
jgi:hypothetical protein